MQKIKTLTGGAVGNVCSRCRVNKDTLYASIIVLSVQKQASKNILSRRTIQVKDIKVEVILGTLWASLRRRSQTYGVTTEKCKLPSWKSTVKFHGNVAEYSTGTLTTSNTSCSGNPRTY